MSHALRILPATCLALLIMRDAGAQQPQNATVTFVVPVDLTRLMPDISRVRVSCGITSLVLKTPSLQASGTGLSRRYNLVGFNEIAVTQGAAVKSPLFVHVSVAESDFLPATGNPSGQVAEYECALVGHSTASNSWGEFIAVNPARTSNSMYWLTPLPSKITGQFVW
ncbi:MAG: hypothetical protein QM696_06505 [Steroidobacteraceae bacterium]